MMHGQKNIKFMSCVCAEWGISPVIRDWINPL